MIIYSLFDGSGIALKPWAEAGHTCYAFNSKEADHGLYDGVAINHPNIHYIDIWIDDSLTAFLWYLDIPKPDFIMSFPPCTDLTNAGSRHWAAKSEVDPLFQIKAAEMCKIAAHVADGFGVPYMIENPVGRLSSLWRKPDYKFNPKDFGGYLPEDDAHPNFPDIIPGRDAYNKKTCLWVGNGFVFPEIKPVPANEADNPGWAKLGGKSARTKLIRSLTPRGFAQAVYEANK